MSRYRLLAWEQHRRPDGTLDLDAAFAAYIPAQAKPSRIRSARDFLAEVEDLTPITKPEAAEIALHGALRILHP
jgi:hypothetical protein